MAERLGEFDLMDTPYLFDAKPSDDIAASLGSVSLYQVAPLEPDVADYNVTLGTGRKLSVEVCGDPNGTPFYLSHGTPGSKHGIRPSAETLREKGYLLVTSDRPGYGDSDPNPGRDVAADVWDIHAIMGALREIYGFGDFYAVGGSGGGPRALGCAALLANEITGVAALACPVPRDAPGIDWYEGLGGHNREELDPDEAVMRRRVSALVTSMQQDPTHLLASVDKDHNSDDARVLDDVINRERHLAGQLRGVQNGPEGWIDDNLAIHYWNPWGFDFSTIRIQNVILWHGTDDKVVPINRTDWLIGNIKYGQVAIVRRASHVGAKEILPVLDKLTHRRNITPNTSSSSPAADYTTFAFSRSSLHGMGPYCDTQPDRNRPIRLPPVRDKYSPPPLREYCDVHYGDHY